MLTRSRWLRALPLCLVAALASAADYTALDRYVASPDASFRYTLVNKVSVLGVTAYQLDMYRRNWLTRPT